MRLATTRALIQTMGDHGLQTWEHEPAPAHGAIPPVISHPHDVVGPLGHMTIYPDGYAGAKPANAVDEQTYARMVEVYGHIESGQSHLKLDSSGCFNDFEGNPIDPLAHPLDYTQALLRAAQFRTESMGYLRDLVKTPAGLQLLSELDSSKHTTTLAGEPPHGSDAVWAADAQQAHRNRFGGPGVGSDSTITFNLDDNDMDAYHLDGFGSHAPWTRDFARYRLYNSLVHAYHYGRGDAADGTHGVDHYGGAIANEDWQAMGLGPESWQPVSENRIRSQMGAPLRPKVAGETYESSVHR